jgi:hypothetical protein
MNRTPGNDRPQTFAFFPIWSTPFCPPDIQLTSGLATLHGRLKIDQIRPIANGPSPERMQTMTCFR